MTRENLLYEVVGLHRKEGAVGIEIEVEGRDLPYPKKTPFWKAVNDPSLRDGGIEYITNGPLPLGDIKTRALKTLYKAKEEKGKVNKDQRRCGTHVHVNVQELTLTEVCTAIVVSSLLDSLLIKYCGEGRDNNLFCKPVVTTNGIASYLDMGINQGMGNPFRFFTNNEFKYSSINLATLCKLGTLEFRAAPYMQDYLEVDMWSTELYNLVHKSAKRWKSPTDFMNWFVNHSKEELLGILFSKEFKETLMKIPSWDKQIDKNVEMCVHLVYSIDWTKVKKVNPKKKKKEMYYGMDAARVNIEPMVDFNVE